MGNKVSRTSAPPSTLSYKIRNYKVVRDLGTGGFAKVVLASDDNTNLVAIKILYSTAVDQWQNFENEFKIQKSLKHEGVVECYESFVDESAKGSRQYCIVQEFCANGDLAGHISTAIPIDLMMKWFIFLLETLAFIHSQGIIHRDIKPENILLTAEMRVKLSDFGIATGKEEAGTKIGTERFVAPEVISEKTYTSKVDIWSLGCVLYQCIIGDKDNFKFREAARADFPLVQDESIKEILRKMLTDAPRRLSAEELLRDPCVIGWKIALAMPLTDAQKTYAASSNVLAPMLSILMAGSVPGRLSVMETLNRAKLLQIKDVRSVLVNSGALVSLITSAGESSADIERVIKCLDSFEGAELRAAKCLELFLDYLYKRKTALLVPLLTRIARQDPGSRALISDDVRTFDLCKSLILTYPEMTVMIRDPTHLTQLIDKLRGKQSEINIAVKEYFASHTLSPTRRSELMKLALNADMFSVLFHNLFDWNTMINSALKKMICLDDLTENVRSEHEAFSCHSCSLNQTLDALCIVCALHSHAQHDIEGKPGASQSRGRCAGARANSQQLNHPLRNMSIPSPQKPPSETGYSNPSASTIHIENDSIKGTVIHPTSLQSSVAIVKTAECFYFEVTAKTTGYTDSMSIGISRLHYSPEMFPGWGPLSIGYQSDGKIYTGDQAKGKSFGVRYRAGDVIGCGVHPNGSVFFTLNGIFIGFCDNFNAIARANVSYYPAIGVQNGPFELDVNFGTKPFLFSFKFADELSSIDKWPTRADVMSELDFNLAKVTLVTKLTRATHRQTITHIILCINALVKKDPETSKFIAQTINEKHLLQYMSDHQADTPLNCRIVKEWFDLSGRNPSPVRDPPPGQRPVEPVPGKKNPAPLPDRPIRPNPFDVNRKMPVSNAYTSVLTAPEQAQLIEQKRSQTGILKQKPESPNITLFLIREGRKGKDVITLPKQGLTMAVLKEAVAEEMEISVADIDVLLYLMPVEHQDKKEEVRLTDKKLPLVLDLSTIEVVLKK